MNQTQAISAFWRWWDEARDQVAKAITDGTVPELADEIAEHIHAIDPGLEWELTPGMAAKHGLVVTPVGAARLRATVARWLAAAPPVDQTWEYHGSRQADPNVVNFRLQFEGHDVDLSGLRFASLEDDDQQELNVTVFHPAFEALSEQECRQISFMALDWIVGEERVERWVGGIDVSLTPSGFALTAADLVAQVNDLASRHVEPQWTLLRSASGAPRTALVQRPLKPVRWPRFDTYVGVSQRYDARTNGFPTKESRDAMQAEEDRLSEEIRGDGELLAVETSNGVRTLHFYVDGATAASVILSQDQEVEVAADPDLDRIRHLAN